MPFTKGQSGNPAGRPKYSITEALERALKRRDPETKKEYKEVIADVAVKMAAKGDIEAIKYINNRTEGMPKQAVDHTTDGERMQMVVYVPEKYADPELS